MSQFYQPTAATASELVADVERAVADGRLRPGDPLPSVRALAGLLGLSPTTVAAALRELRRRGTVVTEDRRRTRISTRPPGPVPAVRRTVPAGARDLAQGNPDPALLPDVRAALARAAGPPRLYGEDPVHGALAAAARARLRAAGIPAEGLCVAGGALDGVERVLAARLRPGDRVAVEDPGYGDLLDLVRALGLVPEPMAVDAAGAHPEALRAALRAGARAVVLTPRGQNPTGAALDAPRARALEAELVAAPDVLLVVDDHLGPVSGARLCVPRPPAGAPWAHVESVAKSLGPDLRLAVVAGDAGTLAQVAWRQSLGPGWVSHLLQQAVADLWADAAVAALLEHAAAVYAQRRAALLAALAGHGIAATGASGLNVWIPAPEEAAAVAGLLARGWAVAPGERHRQRAGPAIRITTARLDPAEAPALARDVAAVLRPARPVRTG